MLMSLDYRKQGLTTVGCALGFLLGAVTVGFAEDTPARVDASPAAIRVVDAATGRGVPLVELTTTTDQTFLTDSHGYVAIDDPTLLGRDVYFHVASHGYELPQDGFGFRGRRVQLEAGSEATVEIQRRNIAERLYRITGAGIYRDSVMLGKPTPIEQPLINASVTGQDSVQTAVVGDRIHWFWGDTDRLEYPLGQFNTSGAVSKLPQAGGLDPADGVDLTYFQGDDGFSRPMFEPEDGILIWIHGVFTVEDPKGNQRILTHFARKQDSATQLSHGLAIWDNQKQQFSPILQYDDEEPLYPRGHSFRVRRSDTQYIYFADPYARLRVPATWEAVTDPQQYEAFTPLQAGSTKIDPSHLDRTPQGKVHFAWKRATPPVGIDLLGQWVRAGILDEEENWFRTTDVATRKPVLLHAGSIHWNPFRQRWIMIAHERWGSPSFLGEVWYTEARQPEGPFPRAVRIVTHDGYSFYNVTQHPFFDQAEGRLIYFEGTYTQLFSKSPVKTPWYDYNQIMYRLDLADPRLDTSVTSTKQKATDSPGKSVAK
jgi:hypothetical protein